MLRIPNIELGWELFKKMLHDLRHSEVGGKAKWLFASLIALLLTVNGLNVVNSYVGRDFMTAIAERNHSAYVMMALLYLGVFAASTVVGVYQRYAEDRLGLLWREFMTRRFLRLYLKSPTYYRINDEVIRNSGVEYPDQRIADDVKTFTVVTLTFVLLTINSIFTVLAFSSVLLAISSWLFVATLVYALIGSYFTFRLGKPLIDLNYTQLDKEAAFRSGLIHVREHAESVALLHREEGLLPRLLRQFEDLAANFRKIIEVNRNMGFFTSGYNYLIQIIPILLVTPLYMRGDVEFGVITQSAMAFSTLVWAFSLVVSQFPSISSYAAVVERLINLWYVIELAQTETVSGLDISEEGDRVAYENLTLLSATDGHVLVQDLNCSIPYGTRLIVTGTDSTVQDALFKATAGIYDLGSGRVRRPSLDKILFLPERPYLPPGTLREALVAAGSEPEHSDERIENALRILGITGIVARVGGLDVEHDWDTILSLQEQRRLSFARVLLASPRFAALYDPFKDCDDETVCDMLRVLTDRGITYLTFGLEGKRGGYDRPEFYDYALDLKPEGKWVWRKLGK